MAEPGGKILLLSQDVNVGVVAARYLNRQGYSVSSVMDQDKALERYAAERPNLLLMDDLGSPRRTLKFLRRLSHLRDASIDIPILLSGAQNRGGSFEEEAQRLGVKAFLFEPFHDLPKLAETIRAVIGEPPPAEKADAVAETSSDSSQPASPSDSQAGNATASQPPGGLGRPATAMGVPQRNPLKDSGRYSGVPPGGLAQPVTSVGPAPGRDPRRPSSPGQTAPSPAGKSPSTAIPAQGGTGSAPPPAYDEPSGEMPRERSSQSAPPDSGSQRAVTTGSQPPPKTPRRDTGARPRQGLASPKTLTGPGPGRRVPSAPPQRPSGAPPQRPSGAPPERLEFKRPPTPDLGSLSDFSVPQLLHMSYVEKFSGMLMIRKSPTEKGIFIQNGNPVFVESDLPEESLGTFLRRIGRLAPEDFQTVEEEMEKTGRQMGDVLVAKGLIDPNELFQMLTEHSTEKLIACFGWYDGVFAMESGNSPSHPVAPLRLQTPRVILDGVGRHYGESFLEKILKIPDHTYIYLREDSPLGQEQLALNTREARLLGLATQGDNLGGVIRFASGRRVEVLRLFYALYLMEVIGFTLEPPVGRSSMPPPMSHGASQTGARGVTAQDGEYSVEDLSDDRPSSTGEPPKPRDSSVMLMSELEGLEDADFFEIHDLPRDASTDAIHKAFRDRAKKFHPDKLQRYPSEVQTRGADVYRKLVSGYRVLADPRQRAEYLSNLEDPEKLQAMIAAEAAQTEIEREASQQIDIGVGKKEPTAPAAANREETASPQEEALKEARALLRAEKVEEGLQKLTELRNENENNPVFEAWYGWALYLYDAERRRKTAEKHLAAARREDPLLSDPYLLMARISEREGDNDMAKDLYNKACELAPSNLDYQREMRLFDMRVRKGKTKPRPEPATSGKPGEPRKKRKKETSGTGLNRDVGTLIRGLFKKKK